MHLVQWDTLWAAEVSLFAVMDHPIICYGHMAPARLLSQLRLLPCVFPPLSDQNQEDSAGRRSSPARGRGKQRWRHRERRRRLFESWQVRTKVWILPAREDVWACSHSRMSALLSSVCFAHYTVLLLILNTWMASCGPRDVNSSRSPHAVHFSLNLCVLYAKGGCHKIHIRSAGQQRVHTAVHWQQWFQTLLRNLITK